MKLTPRQQHSLQLICDTFAPAADGWPSASELGVPQAIADAMDFNPRRGDHKQFLQLLNFWDSQLHSMISVERASRFSTLPEEARVRVLLSWAESSLGRRRAAFQALRKAVVLPLRDVAALAGRAHAGVGQNRLSRSAEPRAIALAHRVS